MPTLGQTVLASKKSLWAGRIISALAVLFMLFDGIVKVMKLAPAVEGTVKLDYPIGYLGGATATQVRVQDPWFLFPVGIGVLAWGGLFLRDDRLPALISSRS